jgi:hypothetical protein
MLVVGMEEKKFLPRALRHLLPIRKSVLMRNATHILKK